jgi:ribosomal protein S7
VKQPMPQDDDDIREVRSQEERRGKRPIDIAAQRRKQILLRKFREALQSQNEETFREAIINELGQLPGTVEYETSMKIWREFRGKFRT